MSKRKQGNNGSPDFVPSEHVTTLASDEENRKVIFSKLAHEQRLRELSQTEIVARQKTRRILQWAGILSGVLAILWAVSFHPVVTRAIEASLSITYPPLNIWHMIPFIGFTAASTFLLMASHRRIEVTDLVNSGTRVTAQSQGELGTQ